MAKKATATNAPPAQVGNQPDQPEAAPAHKADAVSTPLTLTITSKREGFRRAGRAWSVAPTTVDAHDFTPEQLRQLADENGKMLTITGE